MFSICLSAEQTPITLHTYREHLSELSRLEQSIVNSNLPVGAYDNVRLFSCGSLILAFVPTGGAALSPRRSLHQPDRHVEANHQVDLFLRHWSP